MADTKLLVVIGGGLLVGAGAFTAYFLFGNKAMQKDAAQQPILTWEAAWRETRTCLLGKAPASADPTEALQIRALLGDRPSCSLAELGRPEGVASGVDEIEAAWTAEDKAWHALVTAQGDYAKMGPQIAALDQVDQDLRAGAGMTALPFDKPRAVAVAALAPGPAIAGTQGIDIDDLSTRGHVLIGRSARDAVLSDLIVRGPGAGDVAMIPRADGTVAALPDPTWGASSAVTADGQASLTFGPLAPDGTLAAGAAVALTSKTPLRPLAAIGRGPTRAIYALGEKTGGATELVVVRSTDDGAHWSKPRGTAGDWRAEEDRADGGFFLSGLPPAPAPEPAPADDDGAGAPDAQAVWSYVGDPAAEPTPLEGETGADHGDDCVAGARWHLAGYDPLVLQRQVPHGPPAPPVEVEPDATLRACTRDAIAIEMGGKLHRCDAVRCDGGLPAEGRGGYVDVFDGAGVVLARQEGQLIGVWRTGVDPKVVRSPAGAALIGVVAWRDAVHLALRTPVGVRLAPLP